MFFYAFTYRDKEGKLYFSNDVTSFENGITTEAIRELERAVARIHGYMNVTIIGLTKVG